MRIFNTYGPRLRSGDIYGRVVSRFIEQALKGQPLTVFGDGKQTRSFTYVADLIERILKVEASPQARGEILNLGNNKEMQIIDLAHLIKKITNSESKIEFHPLPSDDPRRRCPDIRKVTKILSWQPKTPLEEGLSKTIDWLKQSL